jgi:hypothetical protein
VPFVDAVAGVDEEQIAHHDRRGEGKVMRENGQLEHHVQFPGKIRVDLFGIGLFGERSVVLAVIEPLHVHADELATVGNIVGPVAVDARRGGHALERPIVHPAGRELVVHRLPEELAVGLAEAHDDALVAGDLGVAPALVVGADEDSPISDHRGGIGLRAQFHGPLDVAAGLRKPAVGKMRRPGSVVAQGRPAPLRPISGGDVQCRNAVRGCLRRVDRLAKQFVRLLRPKVPERAPGDDTHGRLRVLERFDQVGADDFSPGPNVHKRDHGVEANAGILVAQRVEQKTHRSAVGFGEHSEHLLADVKLWACQRLDERPHRLVVRGSDSSQCMRCRLAHGWIRVAEQSDECRHLPAGSCTDEP